MLKAEESRLHSEHLKSTIKALKEKLKLFENIATEKDITKKQLEKSDLARAELSSTI